MHNNKTAKRRSFLSKNNSNDSKCQPSHLDMNKDVKEKTFTSFLSNENTLKNVF